MLYIYIYLAYFLYSLLSMFVFSSHIIVNFSTASFTSRKMTNTLAMSAHNFPYFDATTQKI